MNRVIKECNLNDSNIFRKFEYQDENLFSFKTIHSQIKVSRTIFDICIQTFLPVGYPNSVKKEYINFLKKHD